MPVRKSEGEDLSGTASKNKKRPWSIQGRFLFYKLVRFYLLLTLVIYFCNAMVMDGVSGVGA